MIELYPHQIAAVKQLKTGSILWGGVGSGKSLTSLSYYNTKENSKPLYIITTAKKRDNGDWFKEAEMLDLPLDPITVDSWNNIKKYIEVKDSFFIFDEQRVVGSGAWVRSFLKITKKNNWILLSATPGDTWMDYIPVFVANGFYKNRTTFIQRHVVYNQFVLFPKVERYLDVGHLEKLKKYVLVEMKHKQPAEYVHKNMWVEFDEDKYNSLLKTRFNPFTNQPAKNSAEVVFSLRRIVNSDPSRLSKILALLDVHQKLVVFYNFDYELDILREIANMSDADVTEYNGHKHQAIPNSNKWVYLVQYISGGEGWNCTETNTIVFYSQNYSYRMMKQAAGRIDRINTQFGKLYYYHLVSKSSIDSAIRARLRQKKNFNESNFLVAE